MKGICPDLPPIDEDLRGSTVDLFAPAQRPSLLGRGVSCGRSRFLGSGGNLRRFHQLADIRFAASFQNGLAHGVAKP